MLDYLKIKALTVCILLLGGVADGPMASGNTDPESLSDVRILIDVSGSMQLNDPGNLRIPALRLLVNLLPPGSRAGVWLFAAESTPLAPVGNVDDEWTARALESASGIHSHGLLTNIEDVLKVAAEGWNATPENGRKNILLLTDGVVDISKDPEANKSSRTAILTRVIPELQRLSVRVHTIALSENADHDLLKKLSFDTGGGYQSVRSAQQLERAFLALFKKAVPTDSVPLAGDKFSIDSGIDEFSVLVFREPGAQPTRVINPKRTEIAEDDHGENIRWRHEAGHDLITIKQPETGEWRLLANLDPDNQVMIVTDLKLQLNELPNYISEHEAVEFLARITEKGETIVNPDFLSLIEVRLEQTDGLGRKTDWIFKKDPADIGSFRQSVEETLTAGEHTFRIVVNGRTFQRETEHRIPVVEKFMDVEISRTSDPEINSIRIRLIPDPAIIELDSLTADAAVIHPSGEAERIALAQGNGAREMVIGIPSAGERILINFTVSAKTRRGDTVHPPIRPIVVDQHLLDALDKGDEGAAKREPDKDHPETKPVIQQPDWMMTGIIAGTVNLVFLIAGFFIYRFVQKRSAKQQTRLIDRLAA